MYQPTILVLRQKHQVVIACDHHILTHYSKDQIIAADCHFTNIDNSTQPLVNEILRQDLSIHASCLTLAQQLHNRCDSYHEIMLASINHTFLICSDGNLVSNSESVWASGPNSDYVTLIAKALFCTHQKSLENIASQALIQTASLQQKRSGTTQIKTIRPEDVKAL